MYIKRYLEKQLRNTYWQLKGIGIFNLIPLIGLYILIPISNVITYQFYQEPEYLYVNIVKECQFFCPLLSIWWIFFILEHFIEEPGNELLFVDGRNKMVHALIPYVGFIVLMLPLFIVYTRIFPDLWWLYLKLGIVNLLYLSIAYFTAFLSGKITISVIITLCYTIDAILEDTMEAEGISYYNSRVMTGWALFDEMKFFLLVIVVFLIAGSICNYYFPQRSRQ